MKKVILSIVLFNFSFDYSSDLNTKATSSINFKSKEIKLMQMSHISDTSKVCTAGIYQHYKGNYYEVMEIARHSETLEQLVVYRALYDKFGLWVRPLEMFLEDVE